MIIIGGMESPLLQPLLKKVWESPTFGAEGFGLDPAQQAAAGAQMETVHDGVVTELNEYVVRGMPELPAEHRQEMLRAMAAKPVAFSPGLSGGDIANTESLVDLGVVTG